MRNFLAYAGKSGRLLVSAFIGTAFAQMLYVSPPAHAVVLSFDEKSRIQALDGPADEERPARHHAP